MKVLITLLLTGIMCVANANLISNEDFEAGNTGFFTEYTYTGTEYLHPDQTYTIISNPNLVHGAAASYGDHTTGSGNMMAVNGGTNPSKIVWGQNVDLIANTDYIFSIAVSSWTSSNLADLSFTLNSGSMSLGTITAPSVSSVWNEYSLAF